MQQIQLNREVSIQSINDFKKEIETIQTGLLRLHLGKTIRVASIGISSKSEQSFQPLVAQIGSLVLFVLLIPASGPSTSLGYLASSFVQNKRRVKQQILQKKMPGKDHSAILPIFSRKFARCHTLDCASIEGKAAIHIELTKLQQEELMQKIIEAWYLAEQQASLNKEASLVDLMAVAVQKGTCYGQAMKILQVLGSEQSEDITERYLIKCIKEDLHYMHYQILHQLEVFLNNQRSVYAYGLCIQTAKNKLQSLFPSSGKIPHSSGKKDLEYSDSESLEKELLDFIGFLPCSDGSNGRTYAHVIFVNLFNPENGHMITIYYNEIKQRYFWYDPFTDKDGLFSAGNQKAFLEGSVGKLLEYKNSKQWVYFELTAYKL